MTTTLKIISTFAVTGMTAGVFLDCHGVGSHPSLAATLPIGTIAFVVSFVMFMLEKEMAKYDEEQVMRLQHLPIQATTPAPAQAQSSSSHPVHFQEKTV